MGHLGDQTSNIYMSLPTAPRRVMGFTYSLKTDDLYVFSLGSFLPKKVPYQK